MLITYIKNPAHLPFLTLPSPVIEPWHPPAAILTSGFYYSVQAALTNMHYLYKIHAILNILFL